MENTKIEWCDHTGNIWIGCVEVHEGCDNCYARVLNHRWGKNNWGRDVPRVESKNFFVNLVKFQRDAEKLGEIKTVFVGSMMDIFEKPMPVVDSKGERVYVDTGKQHPIDTGDLREIFFSNITDNKYPNLVFLLLTKRPSNINKYIPESWKTNPPANVWFGTSPVNQETFDKLVPQLYQVQGHRFLSIEPMLNAIDIKKELPTGKGQVAFGLLMDWIIVGGESGAKRRVFATNWARKVREDCEITGVPFFMKQIDKVRPIPDDLMIRELPNFNYNLKQTP